MSYTKMCPFMTSTENIDCRGFKVENIGLTAQAVISFRECLQFECMAYYEDEGGIGHCELCHKGKQ